MIGKPFKDFKNAPYPKGSITQYFGENPALYSRFMGLKAHNGHDYVAPWGTPLYAVDEGYVSDVKDSPEGYGKHVRTKSSKFKDGKIAEWTYGHLSKIGVSKGQYVKVGDYIGDMGNTGFVVSSQNANGFWKYNPYLGTHLHLGVRYYNAKGVLDYDNGYFGSVDFKHLLPDVDPVNDDIIGFVGLLRTLLVKLQQAGIEVKNK